jgi:hypothetical protein
LLFLVKHYSVSFTPIKEEFEEQIHPGAIEDPCKGDQLRSALCEIDLQEEDHSKDHPKEGEQDDKYDDTVYLVGSGFG